MLFSNMEPGARALGCFYGALDSSHYGLICKRTSGTYCIAVWATWLWIYLSMRTVSSLLVVTFMAQEGL